MLENSLLYLSLLSGEPLSDQPLRHLLPEAVAAEAPFVVLPASRPSQQYNWASDIHTLKAPYILLLWYWMNKCPMSVRVKRHSDAGALTFQAPTSNVRHKGEANGNTQMHQSSVNCCTLLHTGMHCQNRGKKTQNTRNTIQWGSCAQLLYAHLPPYTYL